MSHLESIRLDDLACFQDWRTAPIGSLLQVGELPKNGAITKISAVFRFDNTLPINGPTKSIMGLDGHPEREKLGPILMQAKQYRSG